MKRLRGQAARLLAAREGVAAIEFALVGALLALALLAMVDSARLAQARMALDHVARAGAQAVILGGDGAAAVAAMRAAAAGTGAGGFRAPPACACPETPEASVPCGTTCAGDAPTSIFYDLAASAEVEGLLGPRVTLRTAYRAQAR